MIPISITNCLGFALLFAAETFMMPALALAQSPEDVRQFRMICNSSDLQKEVRARAKKTGQFDEVELEIEERCPQIDLPSTPLHDTADTAPEASHSGWVYQARYSRDGRTIVSGGRDGTVRVWDALTGKPIRRIVVAKSDPSRKKEGIVRSVTFVGDGTRLAATSDENPVRLIELATGKIVASFPVAGDCCGGTIAGTMTGILFIGGHPDIVDAIDVNTGAIRYRLPGHQTEASSIAVSETAGLVATAASSDYAKPETIQKPHVYLWRLDTGEKVAEFEPAGGTRPGRLAFSRDGTQLAVFKGRAVHVYSVADRRIVQTIGPTRAAFEAAFTADGKGLITCSRHPMLWDLTTGKKLRHFGPFSDLCHSVDVSPDGRCAVTTSMGSDLRIREIATGTFYRRIGSNATTKQ
jgi:WD40 repeat protein